MRRTEGKYKDGQTVCAKEEPKTMLTIRRFVDEIYYCKIQEHPEEKERVYFERELMYPS